MKKLKPLFLLLLVIAGNLGFAQSSQTIRAYIATYKNVAMTEMQRTGVPAAITLAQGIHETGAGTSDLVKSSNNHFGIKCKSDWTGAAVYHDDDAKGECFRKYDDPMDSYRDHSDFLKNRPYYAALFTLNPADYKAWAYGLKKAGYATNPRYPEILIKLIETYDLEDYTMMVLNDKVPADSNMTLWAKAESKQEPEVIAAVQKTTVTYPSGVFKINETSVVFVPKGTAFLKVADDQNISLSRLFEFNDMKPVDIAADDQLIYLQRKRKVGSNEFHMVRPGETPYLISQIEGIRLENLLEYNFLKEGMQPLTGETLYLRYKAPAMPKLALEIRPASAIQSASNADAMVLHTVQPKETMYAIARKYDVLVDDLMKWNELQSSDLRTGQQLRINKKTVDGTY